MVNNAILCFITFAFTYVKKVANANFTSCEQLAAAVSIDFFMVSNLRNMFLYVSKAVRAS